MFLNFLLSSFFNPSWVDSLIFHDVKKVLLSRRFAKNFIIGLQFHVNHKNCSLENLQLYKISFLWSCMIICYAEMINDDNGYETIRTIKLCHSFVEWQYKKSIWIQII